MDRPIDIKVRRRRATRRLAGAAVLVAGIAGVFTFGADWLRPSVRLARIQTGLVDRGALEATVQASGVVVPADERVLSSPVEARVVRLLHRPGDLLRPGDAVLELDATATRLELEQLGDQLARKQSEREQLAIGLEAELADLAGRAESEQLELELTRYQLEQRRRLHTDGLIAEETLRQAELAVRKAEITIQRLDHETTSARKTHRARLDALDLDAAILRKQYDELGRQLDRAATRVDEGGVLTWVVPQAGTTVRRGDEIARLADLASFRVEATVSDAYAARISVGQPVHVVEERNSLEGRVTTILPAIENGALRFIVDLDDPANGRLRQNLRVDVFVVTANRNDALRIPRGPYARSGVGEQQLFVIDGDVARRTEVRLGLGGRERIEVLEGLREGDAVILSDMTDYLHANQIRIR